MDTLRVKINTRYLPITRRSNGDFKQAVLLTLLHRLSGLPNSSVTFIGFARHYSGGTVPVSHRSSLLSLYRHLFLIMQFLLCRIDFANKKPLYTNAKRLYKISFPSLVGQTVISNRQFS